MKNQWEITVISSQEKCMKGIVVSIYFVSETLDTSVFLNDRGAHKIFGGCFQRFICENL